jgi:outer membrane protein OmpA-like peptidoglycan-associated protein
MPPDECLPEPQSPISGPNDAPRIALNILFEFDSDVLTSQDKKTLDILGRAMTSKELAGAAFRLEGHTDAVGKFEYNLELSQRRASAVQRYLLENFGLADNQLVAEGWGEARPLPNIDPEDGRNRRVEVVNLSASRLMTMPENAYQELPPAPYEP